MTQKDKELIEKAHRTPWEEMDELLNQCESDEAYSEIARLLKRRRMRDED